MNIPLKLHQTWLIEIALAVGLATWGVTWAAQAADAKKTARDDRAGTTVTRDNRDNSRANPVRQSPPVVRQSAPPVRIERQPTSFRSTTNNHSVTPRFRSSGASEIRNGSINTGVDRRLAVDDRRKDNPSGSTRTQNNNTSGNRTIGKTSDTTPATRKNIQPDVPKVQTRQKIDAVPIERRSPPPAADTTNRVKTSEIRKRLDNKIETTDKKNVDRKDPKIEGRKLDGPTVIDKKITPPTPNTKIQTKNTDRRINPTDLRTLPTDARTKSTDVRKRLSIDSGKQLDLRDKDLKLKTDTLKTGKTKPPLPDPKQLTNPPGITKKGPGDVVKHDVKKFDPKKQDIKKKPFPDQWKSGELDRLAKGDKAKRIQLADQYKMHQQGDVARRLELQKHAKHLTNPHHGPGPDRFHHGPGPMPPYIHHPHFYHGYVTPNYSRFCFQYSYWGPSFFAGVCWYPRWNPWVEWSWHWHCPAYWDPRPIWCRPVIYDPCPTWVYWETPVFVPLPEVACGTWVDLKPIVVPEAVFDLQLVAVRFVDPGHPDEKLGPRYRVWFRNNSARPVVEPFNVMLFAATGDRLAANLPQAGVRVAAIEAGDVQSVDIRLPIEAMTIGRDAQGKPAPFSTLHVLVDANQAITEVNRTNNGAKLAPADILPVDPAAFELDPDVARPGQAVVLAGEGLGPEPGQILLNIKGQEVEAEILGWYDLGVRCLIPSMALDGPTEAEMIVVRGDGAATNPLKITITP